MEPTLHRSLYSHRLKSRAVGKAIIITKNCLLAAAVLRRMAGLVFLLVFLALVSASLPGFFFWFSGRWLLWA